MTANGHDILLIGASQGGVEAISNLVAQLPRDFPAAVFVVQHVAAESPGLFGRVLERAGRLPAALAIDGEPIERGRIYVAPPNMHMLLKSDHVQVVRGPRENHWRPAIDPLFRSAAVHFGTRVVGVVLTGLLFDGAAGLEAVKRCGGVAIIQDPDDARFPEMPQSALELIEADHCVALSEMGPLLLRLATTPARLLQPPPDDLVREAKIMEKVMKDPESGPPFGAPTDLTCPECGGAIRLADDGQLSRYRCHLGHAYTEGALLAAQNGNLDLALWAALRALKERGALLHKMSVDSRERNRLHSAGDYEQKSAEAFAHADRIQELIQSGLETPATEV